MNITLTVIGIYLLLSYNILPGYWKHYERHHSLETAPKTTTTKEGIPGDPINIGLVGTSSDVINSLTIAGWYQAVHGNVSTIAKEVESIIVNKPDLKAPVSNLYLFGRKEDIAFEQPVSKSPRQRHHVRFWQSDKYGIDGTSLWLGAATYDRSVGLSKFTGQITHHINSDVDEERDKLIDDLNRTGQVTKLYQVTGTGPVINGKNGCGDRYYSDGELSIAVLVKDTFTVNVPVTRLSSSVFVELKNIAWRLLRFFK